MTSTTGRARPKSACRATRVVDAIAGATLAQWIDLNLNVRNMFDSTYPQSPDARAVPAPASARCSRRTCGSEGRRRRAAAEPACYTRASTASRSPSRAGVAKLADARDSKSRGVHPPCGFDSLLRHQPSLPSGLPLSSGSYGWASQPQAKAVPPTLWEDSCHPDRSEGGRLGKPASGEGCPADAVGGQLPSGPQRRRTAAKADGQQRVRAVL